MRCRHFQMFTRELSALLTLVSTVAIAAEAATPNTAPATANQTLSESTSLNLRSAKRRSDVIPQPRIRGKVPVLPPRPPAPEGVIDISFEDFYKMPIGPRGMEFTDKIKALDGKRVRLAGFQVAEMVGVCNAEPDAGSPARKARAMFEASVPGRVMLTPMPDSVNFNHYGLCEDLPPQVAFVTVPELFGQAVPQHPGPLLVTGTLSLGNKSEPDGRVSSVRITLDPAVTANPSSTAFSAKPVTASPKQPTTTAKNISK